MSHQVSKALLAHFFWMAFLIAGVAQKSSLQGVIKDSRTGEALVSATVRVGDRGTTTDLEGYYALDLTPGKHVVEYSYIGYPTVVQIVTLNTGESRILNITLESSPTLLQTATITSGKYEKPLGEVTVSLEVLKPQLIENTNTTSIDEVLDKLPGVSIIDGQANIRGGSGYSYGAGSRVLLLVDDIPALQADAGFPNWDDLPVENIEQIEVVKGAASALYGSSALNGIINVRTAYAKAEPITKVSGFVTSFLSPKDKAKQWWDSAPLKSGLQVSHRQKIKKLDLVLGGFYLNDEGFIEDTYNRYGRFTLGTRYRISDRFSIGFNSNYNVGEGRSFFYWRDGRNNAYRGDTATVNQSDRNRIFIDPFITYFDKRGNRHKFLGRYYGIINNSNAGRSNQSDLFYGEYQFQRKFEDLDLVITTGIVHINTIIEAELYGDARYTSDNLAGYIQLDKKLFDKLNLSAGWRHERNALRSPEFVAGDTIPHGKTIESKPVFRFGMNYQSAEFTFFRASWGQGYRFPTVAEKFITTNLGSTLIIPNPKLISETGWTAEIGLKQGWKVGNLEGFFDFAAYWSEYENMMEFTIVRKIPPPFQAQNIGDTRIKGIDLSIGGQGSLGQTKINIIAGYTYVDPKFQEFTDRDRQDSSVDYNVLKYRNKHSAKMDIEASFKKITLGVAGIYNSHMEAIDRVFESFITGLKEYRMNDTNGYRIFSARAAYTFRQKLKLSLITNNLFNEEYTVRPAQLEAPRNISARIDYTF